MFPGATSTHVADGWVFPGCPHAGPAVSVDGTGRVHVAWYTGQPGRQGLWYAAADGATLLFGEATPLLTGEWVPPSQVHVAAGADGAWIAWEDRREQAAKLLLGRVDAAGKLHPAGASAVAGRLPDLAGADGARLLAWEDGGAVRVRRIAR